MMAGTVLQFGEGNFLRAFTDWMIEMYNRRSGDRLDVTVVKPRKGEIPPVYEKQGNRYHVLLRGMTDGKPVDDRYEVGCISRILSPYSDWDEVVRTALDDSLRFIISNTTEAGIVLDVSDRFDDAPPSSFPGKLAKLLLMRARAKCYGGNRIYIVPHELIDDNGGRLRECVEELFRIWGAEEEAIKWLETRCTFVSTLVDRIVTGHPADTLSLLGQNDGLAVCAEPYALFVIEDRDGIREALPLDRYGLPVVFTDDVISYKLIKVRLLNGAHTSFITAAYLMGYDFVNRAVKDPDLAAFLDRMMKEAASLLPFDSTVTEDYIRSVLDRFANPYIDHALLDISLNSVSKWRTRCLPSLKGIYERTGKLSGCLVFSYAALIRFMSGSMEDGSLVGNRNGETYRIRDTEEVTGFFAEHGHDGDIAGAFTERFFPDIPDRDRFVKEVSAALLKMEEKGIRETLKETLYE